MSSLRSTWTTTTLNHSCFCPSMIGACGTVRPNRKYYPKDLVVSASSVDRGFTDYRCSPPLVAWAWKDRRIIHFLSNMYEATGPATVLRTTVSEEEVTKEEVTCRPVLPDYQAYMRGVDRGDQLIGYYNIGRRSRKWWKRVFSYIIEVAALNAYIIQKHGRPPSEHHKKKHDYLEFRYALAEELIGSFTCRTARVGRSRSLEQQQALCLDSSKSHLPLIDGPKRDCVVCLKVRDVRGLKRSEKGARHESQIRCSVHLCCTRERKCFYKYHTCVNYWE